MPTGLGRQIQGSQRGVRDPFRRQEARRTTSTAMPASIRRPVSAQRGRVARVPRLRRVCRRFRRYLRRDFRRGGGAGAARRRHRGRPAATTSSSALEEAAAAAPRRKIRISALENCATCHGSRCRARRPNLSDLQRTGPGSRVAGIFLDPAKLSAMPRHRQRSFRNRARPAAAPDGSKRARRCP